MFIYSKWKLQTETEINNSSLCKRDNHVNQPVDEVDSESDPLLILLRIELELDSSIFELTDITGEIQNVTKEK